MENQGGWSDVVTPELRAFIAERDTLFIATVNAEGQPYIQHRGGPPGFLKVIDEHTLGFADFSGNQQYITVGNLNDNPRAFIFLMDFANRRRIKIWILGMGANRSDCLSSMSMRGMQTVRSTLSRDSPKRKSPCRCNLFARGSRN
jgi:predicted pyridoxine 5'-phosphate oxidase superfamily flavin-nucleotide-binding protein